LDTQFHLANSSIAALIERWIISPCSTARTATR